MYSQVLIYARVKRIIARSGSLRTAVQAEYTWYVLRMWKIIDFTLKSSWLLINRFFFRNVTSLIQTLLLPFCHNLWSSKLYCPGRWISKYATRDIRCKIDFGVLFQPMSVSNPLQRSLYKLSISISNWIDRFCWVKY